MFKYIFVWLLFAIAFSSDAQLGENDLSSTSPTFSHQYTFLNTEKYFFIDTSFNSLHWYHQFNAGGNDLFGYASLGNIGAPLNSFVHESKVRLWNYYDFGAFNPYFREPQNIPFYRTRSPLTEANYWMGYERGQYFNIYHTQNITENWNFLINYSRLNALGFFTHNHNRESSFLANTNYVNDKGGYRLYAYFLSEKMEIDEFGGLANDSVFEENGANANPRSLLEVNLPTDVRVMRHRQIFLDQRLALNRIFKNAKEDSLNQNTVLNTNLIGVGHTFLYSRKSNVYSGNAGDDFYDSYYFDNGIYRDSSAYQSYENTFYLQGKVGDTTQLDVKAGIKNLSTQYEGYNYRFTSNNWGFTGSMKGKFFDLFDVNASADYIASGSLKESVAMGTEASLKLPWKTKAFGGYNYTLQYPLFFEQFYYSNNFIWQNDFEKESRGKLYYGLKWGKRNKLRISHLTANNFTFYDQDALPAQSSEVVKVFKTELVQNFTIWNFLHQDNHLVYQQVTGNTDALLLPELILRHSLYFEFYLFKGALKCLTGAEVNYFSEFKSPSYNPATGVFYNAQEKEIGAYPLVDVFANFEIRKARIFIKYEHVNQGLNGYSYYAAPNYPFADRVLRVGITWRFFN